MFQGMHVSVELDGLEWALQPQLGVTAAGPSRVEEEEEGDRYMELDVDHEGDDPVGADEEWRYFNKVHEVGSNEKMQQEKKKMDNIKFVIEDIDPEVVPRDEATMLRDAPYVPLTTYDRDNPDIKEGSTFTDRKAFILMIKQYAIKKEFQTFVEHSDKSRYRARCADLVWMESSCKETSWLPHFHGILISYYTIVFSCSVNNFRLCNSVFFMFYQ